MKPCKRCEPPLSDHHIDDRRCAFSDGVFFDANNYSCGTALALRKAVGTESEDWVYSDDQWAGLLKAGVWMTPEDEGGEENYYVDFILVTRYKDRGRTEGLYAVTDSVVFPLTLYVAERVLDRLGA